MGAIDSVFIISGMLHGSPVDPIEFLPITDILISVGILLGVVGCVVIFRVLYKKWKSRIYRRNPSDLLPEKKKNLTDYEKRMIADKINESRRNNIKKSFAGTVSSYGMIFATIGLIMVVLLWFAYVIVERFHR